MYLFYKKVNDDKGLVGLIYNEEPPEGIIGYDGVMEVASIPEPNNNGKQPLLYVNLSNSEVWYEYGNDIPLSDEEQRLSDLEEATELLILESLAGGGE